MNTLLISEPLRKRIFQLLHQAGIYQERSQWLMAVVGKVSVKDLTLEQAQHVISELEKATNAEPAKMKRMGKEIIHLLCELGYTKPDTTPDYARINAWVANSGDRNPKRKTLWQLNYEEMLDVLNQVEAYHKKETKR